MFGGSGLRWRRMAIATLCPVRLTRRAPARIAPSVEPHPSTSSFASGSASTSSGGMSRAIPSTFAARTSVMRCVIGAVVGHVAAPLGLLEPADPVLQAGCAGDRPRPHELLVARVRREAARRPATRRETRIDLGQLLDDRDPPRLRGVREVPVRQQDHRRPVANRDRDRPRTPRRKQPPGVLGASTGTGDSPWRP